MDWPVIEPDLHNESPAANSEATERLPKITICVSSEWNAQKERVEKAKFPL